MAAVSPLLSAQDEQIAAMVEAGPLTSAQLGQIQAQLPTSAQGQQQLGLQKAEEAAAPQLESDIQSNNFLAAFKLAETTGNTDTSGGVPTQNLLLQTLESSQGLTALDPSKDWTQSEVQQYYSALTNPAVYNSNLLGKNPYGNWGDPSKAASDAAANFAADPNAAPNVEQYAGARPTQSFLSKYGGDIISLAAAVAAPYAEGAIATGLAGTSAVSTADTIEAAGIYGAGTGAVESGISGGNPLEGAALGAVSAAGGASTGPLASEVNDLTGLGSTASGALTGAGVGALTGALKGAVTGTGAGKGAELGAVGGAISGGIQGSGVKQQLGSAIGSPAAGIATGLTTSELTGLAGSTLTSPSGKSATSASSTNESSPGVPPAMSTVGATTVADNTGLDPTLNITTPAQTGAGPSTGFVGGLTQGLTSSLGLSDTSGGLAGTLGNVTGSLAPYAAVGAIGLEQAKAGEAADAKNSAQQQSLAAPAISESNTLLGDYNTGTLTPSQQQVVTTGEAQGQQIIQSAQGLSQIAQTAFANYNSGKLNAADQTTLDQTTAAQKQQVASQLASAGITDSTILAAQYQQIDNNAIITKQNMLNNYFNTGNTAYNNWLTATTEGQQTIQAAQEYASNSLQTTLANSMSEANIGIGEVNTAIQTQMTTDANYAAQVSTLLGTLATAYAKQVAGQKSGTSTGGAGNALTQAGSGLTENTGTSTGGIASPGQLSTATGADQQLDSELSGDVSAETADAAANNALDISDAGNDILGNLGNVAGGP